MRPIEFMGSPGSPYTRKMLALMRYRHIPYKIHWTAGQVPDGFPKPKVSLLPTFFLRDHRGQPQAVTDSTPIIRRFEKEFEGRSVIPDHPVMAILNDLIEDYADEWLTKAMFHFRWAHEVDYKNVSPLLIYWGNSVTPDSVAVEQADNFSKRQIERLYVVGSNEITKHIIESSYARFVEILDNLIAIKGFVLGSRPSSSDFAIFGQMTQLTIVEPTSAKITRDKSARVRAWVDRTDDLSGVDPDAETWFNPANFSIALRPLLHEIGQTYGPVMLANSKAVLNGEQEFETTVMGAKWTQPTFKYQAKTLGWIRRAYFDLSSEHAELTKKLLEGTGCEVLFDT